jgi:hypothetical protein
MKVILAGIAGLFFFVFFRNLARDSHSGCLKLTEKLAYKYFQEIVPCHFFTYKIALKLAYDNLS